MLHNLENHVVKLALPMNGGSGQCNNPEHTGNKGGGGEISSHLRCVGVGIKREGLSLKVTLGIG